MKFANPVWLGVFVVLAAIALIVRYRLARRNAVSYSTLKLVRHLPVTWAQRVKKALPFVQFLALAAIAVAAARPQIGKEETRIRTEGIAISMAVDRSASMAFLDCKLGGKQVDRFSAIKDVLRDFVAGDGDLPGRPDDLIGLVAFGGFADSKCPLTIDHGALLEILDDLEIPFHERDNDRKLPVFDRRLARTQAEQMELATAVGEAIAVSTDRLREVEAKSKVMILLTDGADTVAELDPDAPKPIDAARVAVSLGITVYTIAFGTDADEVPVAVKDRFGELRILYQPTRGRSMDAETLEEIAALSQKELGKGKFFRATSTEKLREVYAEIDKLEKTETKGLTFVEYREVYPVPLLVGIGLLLLNLVLVTTRFRSIPS